MPRKPKLGVVGKKQINAKRTLFGSSSCLGTPDIYRGRVATLPPPLPKKTTVAAQNCLFNSVATPFFQGIDPDIFMAQKHLELTLSPTKKTAGKPPKPRNQ